MEMKIATCLLLGCLAMTAAAADVSGTWSGMLSSMGTHGSNETTVYIVLKQTGDQVTGTAGPDKAHQWPIRNAKVAGTNITGEVAEPEGTIFRFTVTADATSMKGDVDVVVAEGPVAKARLDVSRSK
jgi:hypothetical protein